MNNVLSAMHGGVAISLEGQYVTINNNIYKDPVVIARLLSPQELDRVLRFNIDDDKAAEIIERDILDNTFIEFLGITDTVDWEGIEAGIPSTIAEVIVAKSTSYINDPVGAVAEESASIGLVDSMMAFVSRYMSTPFSEVQKLPINEVYRRYAICLQAFATEVPPIEIQE